MPSFERRSLPPSIRARGVTAVLGPTNTGKTHLAIERLVAHKSGMIGLPLRLLAREVYARIVDKVGKDAVALITGEEKIKPKAPRYWVATVEAMPRDLDVEFVAIDEVQLSSDWDRGHVFTDRLLNQRGLSETMLIGAATMRPLIETLIPGVTIVSRPRLSNLSFAGEKKITRLPPRSAIVAFSASEVYAIAELIRRQKGGAAVVMGALSPRTRNAQVELYQSGEVDYLIATDAIGMGLNLDVGHVAFAADRKFDGFRFRTLEPAELGQIAGRAGRHMRDGTFGTCGRCPPFDADFVQAIEDHAFDPITLAQWRNPDLDFSTLKNLQASLQVDPREKGLVRAPQADDVSALEALVRDDDIRALAQTPASVAKLWEVCQIPDYRKVSAQGHAELVSTIFTYLRQDGRLPVDWFARQIAPLDRIDGDIDVLSARIAQIRTWSFVANRGDWLSDPEHWQNVTRRLEDSLSDALHERLASRFVDRRTSVLMRRLRENAMLEADVTGSGDVRVEGQHVGTLLGFQFVPDPKAEGSEAKALVHAAQKALVPEFETRAERFSNAKDEDIALSLDGTVRWIGEPVGKLQEGDALLSPKMRLLADDTLSGVAREKVEQRLNAWIKAHIEKLLGSLLKLSDAPDLVGLARGIGFQIMEALGVLERLKVLQDVRNLDQDARSALRAHGVRFGAYHLYTPLLLKPAPRTLAAQLWALHNGGLDQKGLAEIALLASSGRTSIPVDSEISSGLYKAAGFRVCGPRAIRVDILERLADLIRPAIAHNFGVTPSEAPPGAAEGEGFTVTVAMTSLVGCAGEDFATILTSLGYVRERKPAPVAKASEAEKTQDTPQALPETEQHASDVPQVAAEQSAEAGSEAPLSPSETAPLDVASQDSAPEEAKTSETQENAETETQSGQPHEQGAALPEASAASPAEPVMIEIWRLKRQHREERPARPAPAQRAPRVFQIRPRPGTPEAEAQNQGNRARYPRSGAPDQPREPRLFKPREEKGQERQRSLPSKDQSHRDKRQQTEPRAFGKNRDQRRPPPQGNTARSWSSSTPAREAKPADPNSPFAKLLALKEQMQRPETDKS